jgi:hypothetical protein
MTTARRLALAALCAFATFAYPVLADEDHEHTTKHGGVFAESGHHHYEIVAKDGEIVVYLTHEDGTAQSLAGAKAAAAVLTDGKKVDLALQPEGETLKGSGDFKAGKGSVIVVTVTIPEHEPEQVRVKLE